MAAAPATSNESQPENSRFSLRQRLTLQLIAFAGYIVIRAIGPTLRYKISFEDGGPGDDRTHAIYVFWHRCLIPACWHFRGRDIAVMTSSSFDGEYIARIIEKFGYRAVRGSSTRGGVRALLGMHTEIESGRSVAFTIDGPKGPIYVAKPGPVLLARNTRMPIIPFHVGVQRAWILRSWDRLMIPKPFSRVHLRLGRITQVPPDTGTEEAQRYHAEMQAGLDRARQTAEAWPPAH